MRPHLVSVQARLVTGGCQTGGDAFYLDQGHRRGVEVGMSPDPRADDLGNRSSGTPLGPVLLMPGGDRGSGRAAAIADGATQGAIVPFPRSRLQVLAEAQLRGSGAALGLIWTPLLPAAWSAEKVAACGRHGPLQSTGQRVALAPSYGGLASADPFSLAGQILQLDGGTVVNG